MSDTPTTEPTKTPKAPGRPITIYPNLDAAKAANEDRPLYRVVGFGNERVVAAPAPVIAVGAAMQSLGVTVEKCESKRKDVVAREVDRISKLTPEEKARLLAQLSQ